MRRVIVDTCIWYACFDKTDSNHSYAQKILDILGKNDLIIPFPTLYETLNTRFVKNNYGQMDGLLALLRSSQVHIVDDTPYKELAKNVVLESHDRQKSYSLVDVVIRLMMEDISLGPLAVLTFNVGDFVGVNNTEIVDPRLL